MINSIIAEKDEPKRRDVNIFIAARDNDVEQLKLALEQGQRLDAILPRNGHTPLHTAALWGNEAFIIAALKHESANVWARSRRGLLPYDLAADRRDKHIMKLFYDAMHPGGRVPLSPDPDSDIS